MSELVIEFSYDGFNEFGIATTSMASTITNPFWTIKGAEVSAERVINSPPKAFTKPCEACGVSEFQLGAKQERERIIKLLENLDCEANGKEHDCNPLDGYTIKDLIALIKGEQK